MLFCVPLDWFLDCEFERKVPDSSMCYQHYPAQGD